MGTLMLIRGVPGSGKSTLAAELSKGRDAVHCEADQYFINENGEYQFDPAKLSEAHQECQRKCWDAMAQGKDLIIVSNTFTMEWEMVPYINFANTNDYRVFSMIVENRHDGENVHGCPADKVELMKGRFEIKL